MLKSVCLFFILSFSPYVWSNLREQAEVSFEAYLDSIFRVYDIDLDSIQDDLIQYSKKNYIKSSSLSALFIRKKPKSFKAQFSSKNIAALAHFRKASELPLNEISFKTHALIQQYDLWSTECLLTKAYPLIHVTSQNGLAIYSAEHSVKLFISLYERPDNIPLINKILLLLFTHKLYHHNLDKSAQFEAHLSALNSIEVLSIKKSNSTKSDTTGLKTLKTIEPQFPGGKAALKSFISDYFCYPEMAREFAEQGTVYMYFEVSKTGDVDTVKIFKGPSSILSKECIRILKSMPRWQVGKVNGKAKRFSFSLPIRCRLG